MNNANDFRFTADNYHKELAPPNIKKILLGAIQSKAIKGEYAIEMSTDVCSLKTAEITLDGGGFVFAPGTESSFFIIWK